MNTTKPTHDKPIPETVQKFPMTNRVWAEDSYDPPADTFTFGRELAKIQNEENGFYEGQKMLTKRLYSNPEEFAQSTQTEAGAPDVVWGFGPATKAAAVVTINPALYLNYDVPQNMITYADGTEVNLEPTKTPVARWTKEMFATFAKAMKQSDPEAFIGVLRARLITHPEEWRSARSNAQTATDWVWSDGTTTFELVDTPGQKAWQG
jgi:hypothetical protein